MADHKHERYEVWGLDGISQDAREALEFARGLREDLGAAEDRIRDLERQLDQIRATIEETAVSKADEAVRVHVENDPHIYADGSTS